MRDNVDRICFLLVHFKWWTKLKEKWNANHDGQVDIEKDFPVHLDFLELMWSYFKKLVSLALIQAFEFTFNG